MYKKDYKAIGKIIKTLWWSSKQKEANATLRMLSNKLADYFEKEEREHMIKEKKEHNTSFNYWDMFNREQFLKDCGVK